MALWRAAGPFCPEGQKDTISHKDLLRWIHSVKIIKVIHTHSPKNGSFARSGNNFWETHENHSNMGEAFISLTDVCQTRVVQENLLEDKGRNLKCKMTTRRRAPSLLMLLFIHWSSDCRQTVEYRFRELAAGLHDTKAQGDDLCCQKEVDYFLLICFHQSPCGHFGKSNE